MGDTNGGENKSIGSSILNLFTLLILILSVVELGVDAFIIFSVSGNIFFQLPTLFGIQLFGLPPGSIFFTVIWPANIILGMANLALCIPTWKTAFKNNKPRRLANWLLVLGICLSLIGVGEYILTYFALLQAEQWFSIVHPQ